MTVELVHDDPAPARPTEERISDIEGAIAILLSRPVESTGGPTLVAIDRDDLLLVVAGVFGLLALVLAVKL